MSWTIKYSRQADKFSSNHPELATEIHKALSLFVKKVTGEVVSIDLKKMKGSWDGHLRIRKGDIRIIISVDENQQMIHVKAIDFRGNVY